MEEATSKPKRLGAHTNHEGCQAADLEGTHFLGIRSRCGTIPEQQEDARASSNTSHRTSLPKVVKDEGALLLLWTLDKLFLVTLAFLDSAWVPRPALLPAVDAVRLPEDSSSFAVKHRATTATQESKL